MDTNFVLAYTGEEGIELKTEKSYSEKRKNISANINNDSHGKTELVLNKTYPTQSGREVRPSDRH